jgi:hypothetical protein
MMQTPSPWATKADIEALEADIAALHGNLATVHADLRAVQALLTELRAGGHGGGGCSGPLPSSWR